MALCAIKKGSIKKRIRVWAHAHAHTTQSTTGRIVCYAYKQLPAAAAAAAKSENQSKRHDLQFKWQISQLIATRLAVLSIFCCCCFRCGFFSLCSVNSFFFSTFTINSRLISSAIFISSLSFMILFKVLCECSSGGERDESRSRFVEVHGCFTLENKQTTFTIRCKSLKFNIQCNCQSQLKLKPPPPPRAAAVDVVVVHRKHTFLPPSTFALNFKWHSYGCVAFQRKSKHIL